MFFTSLKLICYCPVCVIERHSSKQPSLGRWWACIGFSLGTVPAYWLPWTAWGLGGPLHSCCGIGSICQERSMHDSFPEAEPRVHYLDPIHSLQQESCCSISLWHAHQGPLKKVKQTGFWKPEIPGIWCWFLTSSGEDKTWKDWISFEEFMSSSEDRRNRRSWTW